VNFETYYKLIQLKGVQLFDSLDRPRLLSGDEEGKVNEVLQVYKKGFPKVNAHIRIGLTFLTG
jgi:hypothetical protein